MFNLPRNAFNLAFIDLSFSLGYFCFPDRVIVLIVVLKWYIAASLSYHILCFCFCCSCCLPILFFLNIRGNIYNVYIISHCTLYIRFFQTFPCYLFQLSIFKHSKLKQTKSAIWFWSSGRTRIFFTFISKMSYTLQTIWCWLSDRS